MSRRTSSLSHLDHVAEKAIPGSIDFSMGFFEKVRPKPRDVSEVENPELPEELRNHPEMTPEKAQSLDKDEELITSTPPDPEFPTGILSIRMLQCFSTQMCIFSNRVPPLQKSTKGTISN